MGKIYALMVLLVLAIGVTEATSAEQVVTICGDDGQCETVIVFTDD